MKTKLGAFFPELLRHLFKKPATIKYPFEKLPIPKDFRGTPVFHSDKCIGCMICIRDCPAEAIEIIKVSDTTISSDGLEKPKKKFKMLLHNDRCIHCAQCVDSCPTQTYTMNTDYEIVAFDRHKLKIEYL
jgi:NAD(P)H-quinone oxidoreductase subunit I